MANYSSICPLQTDRKRQMTIRAISSTVTQVRSVKKTDTFTYNVQRVT